MKEASKLRKSSETNDIYVNPDLTPAEAAIVFRQRQHRRQSIRQRESNSQAANSRSTDASIMNQNVNI